jgi:hypothetical protein
MANQEEEELEEEDKYGEMNDQVNATEGLDNIAYLQRQLLNQVADVDQHMRTYQFNYHLVTQLTIILAQFIAKLMWNIAQSTFSTAQFSFDYHQS